MTISIHRRTRVIGVAASLSILAGLSAVPATAQQDPRDKAVFRPQIPIDEFVLKYQKPS